MSIPLFLWSARYKMLLQPHREIYDLALISLVTTFPARVLIGWAYYRSTYRDRVWQGWAWGARGLQTCLLAPYVYLLFLATVSAEFGRHWLNQYHALLLPIPW